MIKDINVKECAEISGEIFQEIINGIDQEDFLEDQSVVVNDVRYYLSEVENAGWEDDGKYQYRYATYQIVNVNENYKTTKSYNAFISQSVSRTGSYYSDYYYDYLEIESYRMEVEHVPEKIIPAHNVNKLVPFEK